MRVRFLSACIWVSSAPLAHLMRLFTKTNNPQIADKQNQYRKGPALHSWEVTSSDTILHALHKWILSSWFINNHEMSEEMVLLLFWHLGYLCDDIFSTVTCTLLWTCLSHLSRSLLGLVFALSWEKKKQNTYTHIPKSTPHHTLMKIKVKKWRMARHPRCVFKSPENFAPGESSVLLARKGFPFQNVKRRLLLFPLYMGSWSGDPACPPHGWLGAPGPCA